MLLYNSCSTDNGIYKKSVNITNQLIKEIPNPWEEINAEGSDYALRNKMSKSLFLFNSACRKYESSTLDALTNSILVGIEEITIDETINSFYQGRKSREVTANGKLDGVLRFFKIATIQKNNCIYDYVLISTNKKNLDLDTPAFKQFLREIVIN